MAVIQTPDQRVRVFISSTMKELAAERAAVRAAVERLHLTPVLFELGARPHPPKDLYLAYLAQSHVFVGIYHEQYGWIAPGEQVSGLEDEYLAATGKPKLVYVKSPAPGRDPRLADLLRRIADAGLSYRRFGTAGELAELVVEDLAVLLSERFGPASPSPDGAGTPLGGAVPAAGEARRSWTLPAPANRFVGRTAELATIRRLLTEDDARLVTLVGPGGIGKTRLALTAVAGLGDAFPDGVVPVLLAAVRAPDLVPAAIAAELGLPDTVGRSAADAVADVLRSRRMLLLLDNLEHLLPAAPLVARLLAEAPGLRVLATSRELLHLTGERVLAVPPLPVGDLADPRSCADSEAVQLFLDRARAVRGDLVVDGTRLCLVAEICDRLEGLPLAIELAAARVRLLDPEVVLRRLDDRLGLLTGGPRDVADRQRTLRATIRWSVDLLEEHERALLARLGVFSGGFFLDAVEAVDAALADRAGGAGVPDVLETIASLADKSLVRPERPVDGCPRFSILETVREFALGMLRDAGGAEPVRRAHAEFFERMACTSVAGIQTAPGAASWARFAADADNIRAALRYFQAADEPDRIVAMGEGLWPVWWGWSVFDEGVGWMRSALARPVTSPAARATAEFVRGTLTFGHGDPAAAAAQLQEARRLHRDLGDDVRAAVDAILLGIVVGVHDPDGGERLEREAVAVLRERGDRWQYAYALFALGRVLVVSDRPAEAVPLLEESVAIQRRGVPAGGGPHPLLGYAAVNLGWARLGLDDAAGAERAFLEAVDAAGAADLQVRARAVEALAAVALRAGDPHRAALLFGAAEGVRRSIGVGVWLTDVAGHDRLEAALRDELGDAAYRATMEEGAAMSAPEQLALAHGDPAAVRA